MMQTITRYILVALSAVMLENLIFSRALGTSTLILIAKSRKNIVGFGICVTYITTVTSVIQYFADRYIISQNTNVLYKPLFYIIIIGTVYIITLLCLWKYLSKVFGKMKKYIHISAFNCAVLGSMFINSNSNNTIIGYILFGLFSGLGFILAIYMTAIVYDRLCSEKVPLSFRGYPLILIYIGILSMAFYGLTGYGLSF
jgi:electron transport complex protein RnfA